MAFERKHWPQLAQRSSDSLWKHDANPDDTLTTLLMLHVVMAYAAIQDKRWDAAVLHADAIGLAVRAPWLGELARVGQDFAEHRLLEGLRRLKRLSENPNVPPDVRAELQALITRIEAESGDLDSSWVIARILTRFMWQAIEQNAAPATRDLMHFAEQQTSKLGPTRCVRAGAHAGHAGGRRHRPSGRTPRPGLTRMRMRLQQRPHPPRSDCVPAGIRGSARPTACWPMPTPSAASESRGSQRSQPASLIDCPGLSAYDGAFRPLALASSLISHWYFCATRPRVSPLATV